MLESVRLENMVRERDETGMTTAIKGKLEILAGLSPFSITDSSGWQVVSYSETIEVPCWWASSLCGINCTLDSIFGLSEIMLV